LSGEQIKQGLWQQQNQPVPKLSNDKLTHKPGYRYFNKPFIKA